MIRNRSISAPRENRGFLRTRPVGVVDDSFIDDKAGDALRGLKTDSSN